MSRTVLVTGASSGIGRATALRLARGGADVVLVARSADVLAEVAEECELLGGGAVVAVADVADAEQVAAAFDTGEAAFGPIDGVVHAAAVLASGRFEDVPVEVFDRALTVNVLGTANVAREAVMRSRSGQVRSLVVVGSLLGRMSVPYLSGYSASKWAVHGLVRALQIEARTGSGLDVSLVSPAGVDTPIYDNAGTYQGRKAKTPPPKTSPESVAEVVVRSLDHPRRNAPVGVGSNIVATASRMLPPLFDRVITPFMELAVVPRRAAPDDPGNILEPTPGTYGVDGGRGSWIGDLATNAVTTVSGTAQRVLGATGISRTGKGRTRG